MIPNPPENMTRNVTQLWRAEKSAHDATVVIQTMVGCVDARHKTETTKKSDPKNMVKHAPSPAKQRISMRHVNF
jgi:hypothetical protein